MDIRERDLLKDKSRASAKREKNPSFSGRNWSLVPGEGFSCCRLSLSSHSGQVLQTHHTRGAATDQEKI